MMRSKDYWEATYRQLGGRDCDVGAIGSTLLSKLREEFPINQVPAELVAEATRIADVLKLVEKDLQMFVNAVRSIRGHEKFGDES